METTKKRKTKNEQLREHLMGRITKASHIIDAKTRRHEQEIAPYQAEIKICDKMLQELDAAESSGVKDNKQPGDSA